ncbi:MAG: tRNA (adenosine(37)-N6)-dimethylallyltransferase MiaA, partial [Ferruginibacter sp.]
MNNKTCIIIAGPTAIGKTAIAIEVAKNFSSEIISADSRQCYKELNIGVAKPSTAELAEIHHYFINSHSILDNFSAADYEIYAHEAIREIFLKNNTAVVVGGTGLYIKAFCEGLDKIPAIDENLRKEIIHEFEQKGFLWLQEKIKATDPEFYSAGEIQNPHRLVRALEVKLSTGKSILSFQRKQKKTRDFNIIKICLEMPRALLYERINTRVEHMMAIGLVEEVKNLIPYQHLNALQTVGYRELFEYFSNGSPSVSLEKTTQLIKQNTRHYAKR